ncbi:MAG TPA: hypothetical protein PKV72_00225 [Candidatus Peribacteria bacterium]|nr:hypothetical protein [Candidatus Peribacteria bacterium]
MRNAPKNEPTFTLDTASETPWLHPDNVTLDMQLAAAQRVTGILVTKLERGKSTEYDAAIARLRTQDPKLTGIEVSEANIARMTEAIQDLKHRLLAATAIASGRSAEMTSLGAMPYTEL